MLCKLLFATGYEQHDKCKSAKLLVSSAIVTMVLNVILKQQAQSTSKVVGLYTSCDDSYLHTSLCERPALVVVFSICRWKFEVCTETPLEAWGLGGARLRLEDPQEGTCLKLEVSPLEVLSQTHSSVRRMQWHKLIFIVITLLFC